MGLHWSGVEIGEYFELTFLYDDALYTQASVVVPFQRNPSSGPPTCMIDGNGDPCTRESPPSSMVSDA